MQVLPKLTLITQTSLLQGDAFFLLLEQALDGGLGQVLVREPMLDSAKLLAFAAKIRTITEPYHAALVIHTQADIARAVGADGVHVASADMPNIPKVRAWLGGDTPMRLSASCHDAQQLQQAADWGADWACLSPVFATQSHPEATPLGLDRFVSLAQSSPIPVLALGGIHAKHAADLSSYPVAVIRALLHADDAQKTAQALCASDTRR